MKKVSRKGWGEYIRLNSDKGKSGIEISEGVYLSFPKMFHYQDRISQSRFLIGYGINTRAELSEMLGIKCPTLCRMLYYYPPGKILKERLKPSGKKARVISEQIKSGADNNEIIEKTGCSLSYISQIRKRMGENSSSWIPIEKIRNVYKAGLRTDYEIASRLGASSGAVRCLARKVGLRIKLTYQEPEKYQKRNRARNKELEKMVQEVPTLNLNEIGRKYEPPITKQRVDQKIRTIGLIVPYRMNRKITEELRKQGIPIEDLDPVSYSS